MIALRGIAKEFTLQGVRHRLFSGLDLTIPGDRPVALLGRNGAGKSTLLKIIAGTAEPTRGEVLTTGSISWPVGFAGAFHPDLTGAQNTRFVARIYGVDSDALTSFVEAFAELGAHFHLPFRSYSSGMRARLAFGVSMGIPFDTYLVDEVTAVGDGAFREKSSALFLERMERAGAIVVSHSMPLIRQLCRSGIVLEGGTARFFENVNEAVEYHEATLNGATAA